MPHPGPCGHVNGLHVLDLDRGVDELGHVDLARGRGEDHEADEGHDREAGGHEDEPRNLGRVHPRLSADDLDLGPLLEATVHHPSDDRRSDQDRSDTQPPVTGNDEPRHEGCSTSQGQSAGHVGRTSEEDSRHNYEDQQAIAEPLVEAQRIALGDHLRHVAALRQFGFGECEAHSQLGHGRCQSEHPEHHVHFQEDQNRLQSSVAHGEGGDLTTDGAKPPTMLFRKPEEQRVDDQLPDRERPSDCEPPNRTDQDTQHPDVDTVPRSTEQARGRRGRHVHHEAVPERHRERESCADGHETCAPDRGGDRDADEECDRCGHERVQTANSGEPVVALGDLPHEPRSGLEVGVEVLIDRLDQRQEVVVGQVGSPGRVDDEGVEALQEPVHTDGVPVLGQVSEEVLVDLALDRVEPTAGPGRGEKHGDALVREIPVVVRLPQQGLNSLDAAVVRTDLPQDLYGLVGRDLEAEGLTPVRHGLTVVLGPDLPGIATADLVPDRVGLAPLPVVVDDLGDQSALVEPDDVAIVVDASYEDHTGDARAQVEPVAIEHTLAILLGNGRIILDLAHPTLDRVGERFTHAHREGGEEAGEGTDAVRERTVITLEDLICEPTALDERGEGGCEHGGAVVEARDGRRDAAGSLLHSTVTEQGRDGTPGTICTVPIEELVRLLTGRHLGHLSQKQLVELLLTHGQSPVCWLCRTEWFLMERGVTK